MTEKEKATFPIWAATLENIALKRPDKDPLNNNLSVLNDQSDSSVESQRDRILPHLQTVGSLSTLAWHHGIDKCYQKLDCPKGGRVASTRLGSIVVDPAMSCDDTDLMSALHDVHKAALQLYRGGIAAGVVGSTPLVVLVLLCCIEVLYMAGLFSTWRSVL